MGPKEGLAAKMGILAHCKTDPLKTNLPPKHVLGALNANPCISWWAMEMRWRN